MALGEARTLVSSFSPASAFSGPVFTIIGSADLPYCGGDCNNPSLGNFAQGVGKAFPNAKSFASYIQPETGQGINMHLNATAGYAVVQEWIQGMGLGF